MAVAIFNHRACVHSVLSLVRKESSITRIGEFRILLLK